LEADEDAVTYLRVKLSASGTLIVPEAKGGTCNRDQEISLETTVRSPAIIRRSPSGLEA